MSEEEIIKIITNLFNNIGTGNEPFFKAVNSLLDLYNKEKEKNEELESISNCQKQTIDTLNYSIKEFKKNFIYGIDFDNSYISKDKIKEKIKEFETLPLLDIAEKEKFNFKYSIDGLFAIKQGVIYILQELLGD